MTGNKCLIDTCVVIHSFKKTNNVSEKLDVLQELYVSTTVVGELYYGAYKSDDPTKHLAQVQAFLAKCIVVAVDLITADIYGTIKTALAKKGKPIPENDIWIAASAIQHNLPLYTTDKHFGEIDSLSLF